jgi:hypothetical protein
MKLVKELTKFVKCKQCKMIGCIFLVLLVSILIKLSMPDTFEHLKSNQDITFKLQFAIAEPDADLNNFKFSVKNKTGDMIVGVIKGDEEVDFSNLSVSDLPDIIELKITSTTYDIISLSGTGITPKVGSQDTFTIPVTTLDATGKSTEPISLKANIK